MTFIEQNSNEIITEELIQEAIINDEYHGFREDYLVLHCLLRKYKPKTFLEIGTNMGTGTKIIKNALGPDSVVYSLDLPTELAHISLQHPISEGKGDSVGHKCDLPYIQLRGDSLKVDYSALCGPKIDGWFIDGEHDWEHPFYETLSALKSDADIIIYHDSDMAEVWTGLRAALNINPDSSNKYILHRVVDTRIAYAVKK